MITQGKEKNFVNKKKTENNSKLLLYWKFEFDKLLLFYLKKTNEDKIFDSILEKIPGKNDIYYIEHREGMKAFRLKKEPKIAEKDELMIMLKTVDRAIKRSTSKLKLSQLKRIKKQLVKRYEDFGEEFIENEWVKKTI